MSIVTALSYFPITKYPYEFPDHLLQFLTIYFAIFHHGSQSVAICYRRYNLLLHSVSPKFRLLFSCFHKMWGYRTSFISWFINFNVSFWLFSFKCFAILKMCMPFFQNWNWKKLAFLTLLKISEKKISGYDANLFEMTHFLNNIHL